MYINYTYNGGFEEEMKGNGTLGPPPHGVHADFYRATVVCTCAHVTHGGARRMTKSQKESWSCCALSKKGNNIMFEINC